MRAPPEGPFRIRIERVEGFDIGVLIRSAAVAIETAERLQCDLLHHEARRCRVVVTDTAGRTVHSTINLR